jgi:AAA domain
MSDDAISCGRDIAKAIQNGRLKPEQVRALLEKAKNPASKYIALFHTYEEMKNAPPVRFLIQDFLQAEGITMLAGLAGHDKTWLTLEVVRALLSGTPLFGHFKVCEQPKRVIYLVPEISLGAAFFRFCTKFHLDEYIQDGRLLISTLSIGRKIKLTEEELLAKCSGAVIILDTMVRFRKEGAKESDAEGNQELADQLFNLLGLGALAVIALQHSPKGFEQETYMTLENIVRGSGDIGAMLSTAWGLRKITPASDGKRNLVYVENVKPRDFAPPLPFLLRLRPDIDDYGAIGMAKPPGKCDLMMTEITHANTEDDAPDKETWAKEQWTSNKGLGRQKLNNLIKAKFGSGINTTKLCELLKDWKVDAELLGEAETARLDAEQHPLTSIEEEKEVIQ